VGQTEDVIVSQWREVSADEKHDMHGQVDEILRPFGLKTRLLVVDKANSLALFFLCMTLSALMRLRDHGSTGQLRDVVQSLFTFLSRATRQVRVKRLIWSQSDYEQSLEFFSSLQGKQTMQC